TRSPASARYSAPRTAARLGANPASPKAAATATASPAADPGLRRRSRRRPGPTLQPLGNLQDGPLPSQGSFLREVMRHEAAGVGGDRRYVLTRSDARRFAGKDTPNH